MIKLIKRIYDWYMPFWKKMNHDNVFAIAAQAAFFIVLSAVPLKESEATAIRAERK